MRETDAAIARREAVLYEITAETALMYVARTGRSKVVYRTTTGFDHCEFAETAVPPGHRVALIAPFPQLGGPWPGSRPGGRL